jgi:hypothetical protein
MRRARRLLRARAPVGLRGAGRAHAVGHDGGAEAGPMSFTPSMPTDFLQLLLRCVGTCWSGPWRPPSTGTSTGRPGPPGPGPRGTNAAQHAACRYYVAYTTACYLGLPDRLDAGRRPRVRSLTRRRALGAVTPAYRAPGPPEGTPPMTTTHDHPSTSITSYLRALPDGVVRRRPWPCPQIQKRTRTDRKGVQNGDSDRRFTDQPRRPPSSNPAPISTSPPTR